MLIIKNFIFSERGRKRLAGEFFKPLCRFGSLTDALQNLGRIVCILGLAVLFVPLRAGAEPDVVDRIVAIVNDDIIRLQELNRAMAPIENEIHSRGLPPEETRQRLYEARMKMLDELINETLADQQIGEAGIRVGEEDVDAAIERVKAANRFTGEQLRHALQMQGMTMEEYRKEIRKQILRSRLVNRKVKSNIVITDGDIRRYYEAHPEKYGAVKKYRLRNILMRYPETGFGEARSRVRQKMASLVEQLEAGASFARLARDYSQAPNASDGGALGQFTLDDLAAELKPVIGGLEQGEFSGIIETKQGFQIFYVEDIVRTPPKPLESVADEIEKKLYEQQVNEKYNEWIQSLRQDSHIRIIR